MSFASTLEDAPPIAMPSTPLRHLVPVAGSAFPRVAADSAAARDHEFVEMLRAYRCSGGLARGDEVVEMLHAADALDMSWLARAIVQREVLSFDWHDELWIPLFQFDPKDMSLRDAPQRVAAELADAFDGWALAQWFVAGNAWLAGRMPIEVIGDYPADVFHAARADRFVATG